MTSRSQFRWKDLAKSHLTLETRGRLRRAADVPARIPFLMGGLGRRCSANLARLAELRDRHRGRRCFVVGSGPSINAMDLEPLKDEVTFAHNAFFLAHERVGFTPTYTVVEDPLPAEDNCVSLNALEGTTKIFAHDLRYCLNETKNTVFVFFDRNYSRYPEVGFPRFSEDASRAVYWGGTVAYMSIQLAYYMGIREIYLIGIDLSYDVPKDATGPVITSTQPDPNHFDPDYFGPGKRWHQPHVERMARSVTFAAEFMAAHGGALFNATRGGNLHTVPRVNFDEVTRPRG